MNSLFVNRTDAGKQLAKKLKKYKNCKDVVVLALPRGGVPVGYQIASALGIPLDIFLVRKLGVPRQEELAMGAIASGNIKIFNDEIINELGLSEFELNDIIAKEQKILQTREKKYLGNRTPMNIKNQTVILVDDGIATGATIRAALMAIQKLKPAKIIVAVPVASADTIETLKNKTEVDEVISIHTPHPFFAIGSWYQDFSQTKDEEVIACLAKLLSSDD